MSEALARKDNELTAEFTRFESRLNGSGELLRSVREAGQAGFMRLGLPSPRDEDWRFTNLAPISRRPLSPAEPRAISAAEAAALVPDPSAPRLVFVNGAFCEGASIVPQVLPTGVTIRSLERAVRGGGAAGAIVSRELCRHAPLDTDPIAALNSSFVHDGAIIALDKNVEFDQAIFLLFVSTADSASGASYPRVLFTGGENSRGTVVEIHASLGGDSWLAGSVTEINAAAGAQLNHVTVARENTESFHLRALYVRQQSGSHVALHAFNFGGKLTRNNLEIGYDGPGCTTVMNGLTVIDGEQHVDNHTVLDHRHPHCESREIYKGVYDGRSRGVFSGTIVVRPDAQKTNAIQSNRAIVLTSEAEVNSKPQLKIWADDVKCTHGATVGQLDENALFYLRSRGIGAEQARAILIRAFADELVSEIPDAGGLAAMLETLIHEKLRAE